MKTSCVLTENDIKNLYITTVSGINEAMKNGEVFNPESFMQTMFDIYNEDNDPVTGALFVQQLPSIINIIVSKPSMRGVKIDKTLDLLDLRDKFLDPDNGINNVFEMFTSQVKSSKVNIDEFYEEKIFNLNFEQNNSLESKDVVENDINQSIINGANKSFLIFFDTETTGLPKNWKAPATDINNWPRLVQLAYLIYDFNGNLIHSSNQIIKPIGFTIPIDASKVHGITTEEAILSGSKIEEIFEIFLVHLKRAHVIVAHNMAYDEKIIGAELIRLGLENVLETKKKICTMESTVELCKIKGQYGYKWPKLEELHRYLFNFDFDGAHDALADIQATAKCFWKLVDMKVFNIDSINESDNLELKVEKLLFLPAFSLYPTAFKFHRFTDLIFISIKRLVKEIEFTPKLFPGDDSDRISVSRPEEIYFKVVDTELEKKLNLAINSFHPMTFVYRPSKEANTNILLDFYFKGEND